MNTILLFDKSSQFTGLKQTLELSGFRVACARNDLEGLDSILQSSFDLVIIPSRSSGIDTKLLADYLETMSCKTILVTISQTHEVEISQLPEGELPAFFTRFFIETIQYLHIEQQQTRRKKKTSLRHALIHSSPGMSR